MPLNKETKLGTFSSFKKMHTVIDMDTKQCPVKSNKHFF